jgi:hypothetical protein
VGEWVAPSGSGVGGGVGAGVGAGVATWMAKPAAACGSTLARAVAISEADGTTTAVSELEVTS